MKLLLLLGLLISSNLYAQGRDFQMVFDFSEGSSETDDDMFKPRTVGYSLSYEQEIDENLYGIVGYSEGGGRTKSKSGQSIELYKSYSIGIGVKF